MDSPRVALDPTMNLVLVRSLRTLKAGPRDKRAGFGHDSGKDGSNTESY